MCGAMTRRNSATHLKKRCILDVNFGRRNFLRLAVAVDTGIAAVRAALSLATQGVDDCMLLAHRPERFVDFLFSRLEGNENS